MRIFVLLLLPATILAQGYEYPSIQLRGNYLFSYYVSHAMHSTPWWPSWSPDGKWIAVSMQGAIWKVDPESGAATQLTHSRKLHGSPAWSPDGRWIVYTADDHWKTIQLEILNVDTGETRSLTEGNAVYLDPAWSPDGSRLAYVTSLPSGNLNVHVRSIRDGTWAGEAVAVTLDHDFGHSRQYFSNWDYHTQPAWMPDSKNLLIVANRNVALGAGNLWRVAVEPDAMRNAKLVVEEQTLYRTRPDVSKDGTRLVYAGTGGATDQYNHLYVLPTTGGQPFKITFGDFDHFHPRWSPDGERIAFLSNRSGLPQLNVLEMSGGRRREIRITQRVWKQPAGRLSVRVLDESTGQVTPARIAGIASDGKLYGPDDAFVFNARMPYGLERIFFSSGEYAVQVPTGELTVEASKGFEYWPATARVHIEAGKTANVTLILKRLADLHARGWYNGTTHTHMNYGGPARITPETQLRMAESQGMDIVNALVANKDNRILDWQHFVEGGREHPSSRLAARSMVIVGEEIRPSFWGHTFATGMRDHLVQPFVTGYEGTAFASLYPANTTMLRNAKSQGAVTGYVHAFGGEGDPLAGGLGGAKGYAVDVAVGAIDALEWSAASRGSLIPLFHAWNNDFRITPVGGEDALNNMQDQRPIGIIRTYARLGNDFSARAWLDALRNGRTFFTSGPLLDFRVNGKSPGDQIALAASGGTVAVEADVWSATPLTRILIYRNGAVVREVAIPAGARQMKVAEKVEMKSSGWLSMVIEAEDFRPAVTKSYGQAATGAVRVYCGGKPIRSKESAEYFLRWLAKLREQTTPEAMWRSTAERAKVFALYEEAARVYEQRAREAMQ